MKRALTLICGGLLLLQCAGAGARQKNKDPLSDEQVEQVREAADKPTERIKLYIKFIEQRTSEIHQNAAHPKTQRPEVELHNLMQEFTRLADELQDNVSSYADAHADVRKPLKELIEHSAKWPAVLNEPHQSTTYDFARKTALDAAMSTNDMAKKLLDQQDQYFSKHKAPKQSEAAPEQSGARPEQR